MELRSRIEIRTPSPVQLIHHPLYSEKDIEVKMKREDLIHPVISGNKWRKLRHNLTFAKDKVYKGILTFGGSFSNHLHAAAYATQAAGLKMVAIIRGEDDPHNPTLKDLRKCGVELVFIDRKNYRQKEDEHFLENLMQEYPDYYIVPEGGNNDLGIDGVIESIAELDELPEHIFVSAGRGSTAIGLAKGIELFPNTKLHVIACVRDQGLGRYIQKSVSNSEQVRVYDQYALGGFAKTNQELIQFINDYVRTTGIPLDPVYTGKMVSAFHDMLLNDAFPPKSRVLLFHTGGLQGNQGHNYIHRNKPEMHLT